MTHAYDENCPCGVCIQKTAMFEQWEQEEQDMLAWTAELEPTSEDMPDEPEDDAILDAFWEESEPHYTDQEILAMLFEEADARMGDRAP